jgi:hypothetical protein
MDYRIVVAIVVLYIIGEWVYAYYHNDPVLLIPRSRRTRRLRRKNRRRRRNSSPHNTVWSEYQ